MQVNAHSFITAVKFALATAGKSDTRWQINSVCLSGRHIYGTDGHRFSQVDTQWAFPAGVILERPGVEQLVKAIKPRQGLDELEIQVLDDSVRFEFNGLQVTAPRHTGARYPDMARVYPAWIDDDGRTPAGLHGLNADYIAEAGKACKLLANRKYRGVKMHTNAANEVVIFEPGIVPEDFPGIERAFVCVMPMRL